MAAKTIPIKGEMVPPIVDGGLFHIAKVTVGSNGSTGNDVLVPTEAATTALFNVKAGTIVHEVLAKVVTAYTGSAAITLGDSDDADALLSVEISSLTLVNVGAALAKEYTSAQDIIATFTTGTDSKVGAVKFWITFKTDLDKVNTYNY